MARVFLSYDREDAARARTIALALEKAGPNTQIKKAPPGIAAAGLFFGCWTILTV